MKETMSRISVIVPVYNVEDYVAKCLDSLVNQTYLNLEIIVVEDCSTDNSLKICQKYEKRYSQIKLFKNKENKGLSYSRNKGLQEATGTYVGFIDSDDYVGQDYYSSLIETMKKEQADIVVCDINLVYSNYSDRKKCGNLSNQMLDFVNNGLAASACNKLFKKDLFFINPFEVGKYNEDIAVVIPLMLKAKKVVYQPDVYYNYVQRKTSIQNGALSDKRLDIFRAVDLTLEKIKDNKDYQLYKNAIVYQQLITFMMYVPEKEKKFGKRYSFLKKFRQYSKKYSFLQNPHFQEEIKNFRKLYRYYYQLLMFFIDHGFVFFASLLISFRLCYQNRNTNVVKKDIQLEDLILLAKKQQSMEPVSKKVSVVVPNYNYNHYLYERIYSILYQTYKIDEIIILDDCSTDDSRTTIDNIIKHLRPYIQIEKQYNQENSGRACIQWEKGMNLAKMPYVWIAEADDYSDAQFLSKAMNNFKDEEVVISYTDTAFIDQNGQRILKSITSEIDIMKTGHWNKNYINSGKDEFSNYTFLNCTIANVSSAIIKKDNYEHEFSLAKQYRQAGDWIFYANVMQKGKIAYTAKAYNYYRVHTNNVSTVTKKEDHLNEIKKIHQYFDNTFHLEQWQKEAIENRYIFLKKVWNLEEVKK